MGLEVRRDNGVDSGVSKPVCGGDEDGQRREENEGEATDRGKGSYRKREREGGKNGGEKIEELVREGVIIYSRLVDFKLPFSIIF